jgi:hypothetical protein
LGMETRHLRGPVSFCYGVSREPTQRSPHRCGDGTQRQHVERAARYASAGLCIAQRPNHSVCALLGAEAGARPPFSSPDPSFANCRRRYPRVGCGHDRMERTVLGAPRGSAVALLTWRGLPRIAGVFSPRTNWRPRAYWEPEELRSNRSYTFVRLENRWPGLRIERRALVCATPTLQSSGPRASGRRTQWPMNLPFLGMAAGIGLLLLMILFV